MSSDNVEAPVTGDLIVRIRVQPEPVVILTLDAPDEAGLQSWHSELVGVLLSGGETPDEFVPVLMSTGMAALHKLVPSLEVDQLQVRLDESTDPIEVVGFGGVHFLQSEWDAVKRSA